MTNLLSRIAASILSMLISLNVQAKGSVQKMIEEKLAYQQ